MPRKKLPPFWLRIIAAVVILLTLSEGLLRIVGFGYSSHYWQKAPDGQHWQPNPVYYRNWLPPATRVLPRDAKVPIKKTAEKTRILLIGSSFLQGSHEAEFNLTQQLRSLLPADKFELIEASIPGINSDATRAIFEDSLALKPDICVLLCGHQEFMQPIERPNFHTGIKLQQLYQHLKRRGHSGQTWQGADTFPDHTITPGDLKNEAVYLRFEANLAAIVRSSEQRNISLFACNLPSNIQSIGPFASLPGTPMAKDDLSAMVSQVQEAINLMYKGNLQGAANTLGAALKREDQFAVSHHVIATLLAKDQRSGRARAHFERALDLDARPRRADQKINQLIAASGARLIDLKKVIPLQRPGLFHDHLHLNFEGNYLAALTCAEAIAPDALLRIAPAAVSNQLGRTKAQAASIRSRFIDELVTPPFTLQWNHNLRFEQMRADWHPTSPQPLPPERIEQRISENPYDLEAALAKTYPTPEATIAAYKKLTQRFRDCPDAFAALGQAYAATRDLNRAKKNYTRALELDPAHGIASVEFAKLWLLQGRHQKALDQLNAARNATPHDANVLATTGRIFLDAKYLQQAENYLAQAASVAPDRADIIGDLNNLRESLQDAPRELNNQATQLMREEKYVEALAKYREALALAPDAIPAINNLAYLLATAPDAEARNGEEAVKLAEKMLAQQPDLAQPGYRATYAAALAETGEFEKAVEVLIQAIKEAEQLQLQNDRALFLQVLEQYKEGEPYRHQPPGK